MEANNVKSVILGTIGLDYIYDKNKEPIENFGGTALYAAIASSHFTKTGVISIIGKKDEQKLKQLLNIRSIDLTGLQTGTNTFKWYAKYSEDMNTAITIKTELNSLTEFKPDIPTEYKENKYYFIANTDPVHQNKIIDSLINPRFVILDTMNMWINEKKSELEKAIKKSDLLIINDEEIRSLFKENNLFKCAKYAIHLGTNYVIIKKGEHGSILVAKNNEQFLLPSYPIENLTDPTGCGDSFGGTIIGYIAKHEKTDFKTMKNAMLYATTIASFNAEHQGPNYILNLTQEKIEQRKNELLEKIRI